MADELGTPTLRTGDAQQAQQSFLTSVFGWMFLGLALTAGIAAYVAVSTDMSAGSRRPRSPTSGCSSR